MSSALQPAKADSTQPRERNGRWGRTNRAPEDSLPGVRSFDADASDFTVASQGDKHEFAGSVTAPPPSPTPPGQFAGQTLHSGDRVTLRGVRGCRVISVESGIVTVRPPEGGRMVGNLGEVTFEPEDESELYANVQVEADIARMLGSVKNMSRVVKDELNRATTDRERAALDELAMMYADGRMPADRYVYVMRATQDAPLAANHAALAIAMRKHLSADHFAVLTEAARAAGAELPG